MYAGRTSYLPLCFIFVHLAVSGLCDLCFYGLGPTGSGPAETGSLRQATGRRINRRQWVEIKSWRYSIYRIILRPDGRSVRQFVGRADNIGEAVRRAHEIYEEAKKEHVYAVEVIDRETAADVAVYRVDRSNSTKSPPVRRQTRQDRF
jgi:hypothetical protein